MHEPGHGDVHEAAVRDRNIRSAYIHVMTDAAVSVLAIIGLVLARASGWLWMDPFAGVIDALVIAIWLRARALWPRSMPRGRLDTETAGS
ncbi:hypothetical protein [Paraburkholderia ultramafica]|uniref:hypothetical protein n=1 Tax=Paraburkholderia ultramafica TaxID=1544867 RepID=UPI0015833CF8|nr:hypothetical protein [Paraburkholderia ultramafica]